MDDVGRSWLGVVCCLGVLLLTGFLTACENSLIELKESEAEKLSQKGRRGRTLGRLLADSGRLVTSGLILRSLLLMAFSAAAQVCFFGRLSAALGEGRGMKLLALLIILCISAFVECAFGIVIPKRLCAAGRITGRFAYRSCVLYSAALMLTLPLEKAVSGISMALLRLMGIKRSELEDTVTEEEILMMVDAVNETGGIEESQAEMISNIFEFDDLEVHEIMTHRTEITAVPKEATVGEAARAVIENGFSRLPVYEGGIDRICGVVLAKDLLRSAFEGESAERPLTGLIREIRFVPESCRCDDLLEDLTSKRIQMVVVVDEYGGTAGIVTMEDLLEAIVGSIQDEYDNEMPDIQEITPNTFDISGRAPLGEALEALGAVPPEGSIHDTIGGFVTELLGHIPEQGESPEVRWQNISFRVIRAGGKTIEKLRAVTDRSERTTQ